MNIYSQNKTCACPINTAKKPTAAINFADQGDVGFLISM